MKRSVRRPWARRRRAASAITSLTSLIPEVTAEKGRKLDLVAWAMIRARVVFPAPGGPQKMSDGTRSAAMARARNPDSPTTFPWPTTSSRVRGRIRSASGEPAPGEISDSAGFGRAGSWSSKRVPGIPLGYLLHLHPRIVEAGAAPEVGQGVGHQGVGGGPREGVVAPDPLGEEDDPRPEIGVLLRQAAH